MVKTLDSNIYKSLQVVVDNHNYIIGPDFAKITDSSKVKKAESNIENNIELAEEKLIELERQIELKKQELVELEQNEINKINIKKQDLLNSAEKEKNEIIDSAYEQIKLKETNGYQNGYDKGYNESLNEIKLNLTEKFQKLDSLINSITQEKQRNIENYKDDIIEIIKTISFNIIQYEISENSEKILLKLIDNILVEIGNTEKLSIKLNSEQYKNIETIKKQISLRLPALENIHFITDDTLQSGGCKIETDAGNFDASIKTQFENLVNTLKETIQ